MSQHFVSSDQGLDGIQQAIDAAKAGDEVVCKAGIYEGATAIHLKSGVDLVSESGSEKTTLSLNLPAYAVVFAINCESVRIRGFSLEQKTDGNQQVSLFKAFLSKDIYFQNNILVGKGEVTRGVEYLGSTGLVIGNLIANFQCYGVKIMSYKGSQSNVNIEGRNKVENNQWGILYEDSTGIISGNVISDNEIGIQCDFSFMTIESRNRVECNGCGITFFGSIGTISDSLILGNKTGINVSAQEAKASDVIIERGNIVEGNVDGILYIDSVGSICGNVISNNKNVGIVLCENMIEGLQTEISISQNIIYENISSAISVSNYNAAIVSNMIHRNSRRIATSMNINAKEVDFSNNLSWRNVDTGRSDRLKNYGRGEWHKQYDVLQQDASQKFVRAGLGWGAMADVRDALPETKAKHLSTLNITGMSYQPINDKGAFNTNPEPAWPTKLSGSLHRFTSSFSDAKHGKEASSTLPGCIVVLEAGMPEQYQNEMMQHAKLKWGKKTDELVYWETVRGSSEVGNDKSEDKPEFQSRLREAMQENDQPRSTSLLFSILIRAGLVYLMPAILLLAAATATALRLEPSWIQPLHEWVSALEMGDYIFVVLLVGVMFHFIVPSHLNVITQQIIEVAEGFSVPVTGLMKFFRPKMVTDFQERLWIEHRFFRRWPVFGKRKMVVLFWDDMDSSNEKDVQCIELIRDIAQNMGVPFLLFVSLHDAGLLPVCLPRIHEDPENGDFVSWMVLKESAGVIDPAESLGFQDIIQHLFEKLNEGDLRERLNNSDIDTIDLPLLQLLMSKHRLPLRFACKDEKEKGENEDDEYFTGCIRKPSFIDIQGWLKATVTKGKKWQVMDGCKERMPEPTHESGQWTWCSSQNQVSEKAGNITWRVLVTRPAYRDVVKKALENWKISGSSVYADVFQERLDVAAGETIYLNWANSFLAEGAENEQSYAYASLALHSAIDCLHEEDAASHFPKLFDLRNEVIGALLKSEHPEPERIAGLVLCYSGHLGDDKKHEWLRDSLDVMLKELNYQLNRLTESTVPTNKDHADKIADAVLAKKVCNDMTYKIDTLLFSSPSLSAGLFRRFRSVHWHWLKDTPGIEMPVISEYKPNTPESLKRTFHDMWMDVWEQGDVSEDVARNMGRRCAHAPVESISAMIGSAKWHVQRSVRLESASTDVEVNHLAGPEVFALSQLFTLLIKEWNKPAHISNDDVTKRLPFFRYWPAFRQAMQDEEEDLKAMCQPPVIQLEGVGYGMDSGNEVHQIEWYRDGRLMELLEEKKDD